MGRNAARFGVPVQGGEPAGTLVGTTYTVGKDVTPGSLKDLILQKCKGGIGAPWAEDVRPTFFADSAEKGGSYQSYFSLKDHRIRHVRTVNGPAERFQGSLRGPPTCSM